MKWFTKTMLLLTVCLLLPCVATAFSSEEVMPIKGGNSMEGATILTEEKYARLLSDEVRGPSGKRYYSITAPNEGTYYIHFSVEAPGEIIVEAKWENGYNAAREVISEEGMLSFQAKKGEAFYVRTQPSVLTDGGKYTFSVCFDGFHVPSIESEIAHYATCSAEGEIIYPCTLCGQPGKVESIPKLPHTLGDWQKERNPGCTTIGLNVQRCTVCGEIVNQQEIPAMGHGSSKQIVTKPATCRETGLMSEQCTICLETLSTQVLPMGDHTPGVMKTVMAASCTTNGRGEQRCTVCNALLKEETTSAYGHNYSEWETIIEPTKKAEGQKMRYCYNCANIEYEKIEKLPKFMGIF